MKPINNIFGVYSQYRSKTFLGDLNGKHVFTPTPSAGIVHMWCCVRDLDFKSMTSLS
jgi:hypothetical protein